MADANSMVTNFASLIDKIENKQILLPHFQRDFVWKDEEMQCKLIASVLAKMPIGSILLLQGQKGEYLSREIGRSKAVNYDDIPQEVDYLLDGQQRVTVLTNVFSNVIFDDREQRFQNLIKPYALKKRFFLVLPKWTDIDKDMDTDDLFNIHTLVFPFDCEKDEPNYLSGSILKYIKAIPFTNNDQNPYSPSCDPSTALTTFCVSQSDGYYIPLYLLIESGKDDQKRKINLTFTSTMDEIASLIAQEINDGIINKKIGSEECNCFIDSIFGSYDQEDIQKIKDGDDDLRKRLLKGLQKYWCDQMKRFLMSCIRELKLTRIHVSAKDRARAIDIYENLNRGGISLNTFDLIMARVATVDSDKSFFDTITEGMMKTRDYSAEMASDDIKGILIKRLDDNNNPYNATMETGCYDARKNEISKSYINTFLDVLGLYYGNEDFNVDGFKVEQMKKEAILDISAGFISEKCEKIIEAVDRALFFFQTRCGIRTIDEIHYNLMLVLVSAVMLKDEYYNSKDCHNLLEAWYWSSLFSGEYEVNQNQRMISDLNLIIKTFMRSQNTAWINERKDKVLGKDFYSDKKLWLMERVQTAGRLPKGNMRYYVCQYYLSKSYSDMFDTNGANISAFYRGALEAHHIIPLGSVTTIGQSSKALRENESCICNCPVNFVFITKEENNAIGAKDLSQYIGSITSEAKNALQIPAFTRDDLTEDKIKGFLEQRFDQLQGDIKNRIQKCLQGTWQ